jgi:hypothetical protein
VWALQSGADRRKLQLVFVICLVQVPAGF